MKEWRGLERVFRLSVGVEIGAHALALLAALEFKRLLQKDMMDGAIENEQGGQVINLSSAEWCALAGIFDRKAYDRAKAKLEEHGIVGIQREGRVLRITLWPDLENKASVSAPKDQEEQVESNITRDVTPDRTSSETIHETSGWTPNGTLGGTSDGAKHQEPSQTRNITYKCNKYKLKRYSLYCYSLTRNSLLINTKINNSNSKSYMSNNNEQRNNKPYLIHKLIHKSVDKIAEKREFGDKKTVDKISPKIKPVDKRVLDKNARFPDNQKEIISSKFRRLWQGEMGQELTAYQEEGILRFIRWGFSEEILIEALRCAVMADRKHMGYVLGVLRNWYNQGVRELRDISHVQQRWQDQRFLQRSVNEVV